MGTKGVTLIELMAAVALVSGVLVSIALFFPKASKSAIMGHYQSAAKDLGASLMQELKQNPYPLVAVTNPAIAWPTTAAFPISGTAGVDICNCSKEDPDTFPEYDRMTQNNVVFIRRLCVNLVQNPPAPPNWVGLCPVADGSTDQGIKNIRIRVSWTITPGVFQSIDMTSLVSRS